MRRKIGLFHFLSREAIGKSHFCSETRKIIFYIVLLVILKELFMCDYFWLHRLSAVKCDYNSYLIITILICYQTLAHWKCITKNMQMQQFKNKYTLCCRIIVFQAVDSLFHKAGREFGEFCLKVNQFITMHISFGSEWIQNSFSPPQRFLWTRCSSWHQNLQEKWSLDWIQRFSSRQRHTRST